MTTPYDAYCEKQATLALGLQALNQVTALPGLIAMGGSALKFLGRGFGTKAAPSGLYNAGKAVEGFGNRAQFATNQFMNKDTFFKGQLKLPSMQYDLSKAPGIIRHPANLIGMNTTGPQKMTLQRGAVWAGGALTLGQVGSTLAGGGQAPAPQPPRPGLAYDPMEVKMGALKQAADEFARLARMLEE